MNLNSRAWNKVIHRLMIVGLAGSAAAHGQVAAPSPPPIAAPADTSPSARAPMPVDPKPIQAARLRDGEHLVLDGTLDSPAWQRAPVHDQFTEFEPRRGGNPPSFTRVQVLFDESALYVGITALDDNPQEIRAPLVRHDGVIRTQDYVSVFIDAIGKKQSAQFFSVNASGSTGDGMYNAADDVEDLAPDFDFDATSARNANGYTAVLRIPFASLRFSSTGSSDWRIMVARRMPRDQSYMWLSVPLPTDAPSFLAAMQPLRGIELPKQGNFLTLRPSVTARHTSDTRPGRSAHTADGLQGSLDLKWRASPELVIDSTLKPDFSQVALDVPQLSGNTGFALYLPEKRPFFFESSDLLHSPTEALYTRSFTAPRWGVRSTWRDNTVAGTAFVVDDQGGGETLLPHAYGTGTALQPGSRSLSARVNADLDGAARFQLAGILAARRYEGDRGDNTVAGPDINWQVDEAWRLRAQWLRSQTTAQPDQAGSLSRGPRSVGDSVVVKATRSTDRIQLDFAGFDLSPQFRHDTGFVNQAGIREFDLRQGGVFREMASINEMWLNLRESQVRDRIDGKSVQEYVTPEVYMTLPHDTSFWIQWHGLSKRRVAAGERLLSEHYWSGNYHTTPVKWMPALDATLILGRLTDVDAGIVRPGGQMNLMLQTRPFDSVEIEPSLSAAWLKNGGLLAYRETASQVLGVWHIDAKQSLRLIVQRSTVDRKPESGLVANRQSGLTSSLTYALRRSQGTVLYAGATQSHSGVGATNIARGTEAFVKVQVDFDEAHALLGG